VPTDPSPESPHGTRVQGVEPFRDTKDLSESDKAALMGGTLQKIYKW
jgi:L-fuconolactonase